MISETYSLTPRRQSLLFTRDPRGWRQDDAKWGQVFWRPWYRENQLDRNKKSAGVPKVFGIPNPKNKTWRLHRVNFLDCVRTRATPNMGGELALQTTVALLLGMASYRESAVKGFDPTAKTVTDKPAPRPQYEGQGKNTPGGWPKSPAA